ncbi:MAG: hypothetical protein FWC09_07790, partial [Lachnospiraceae bacterium]|nr:hypothetical protein [Lachnospiraceae bacterium]
AVTDGFKGFHLASAAVKYILKYFGNEQLFYAHAVMFYESAGKALEDSGFVPTGFTYGVCDAKKHLTQLNYKSQKHTWAVYIRNNGKNIIKRVYVPARFTQIVEELYNSIGIFPDINLDYHEPTTESRIQLKQDDYHKTLYLYVIKSGFDLHKRIKEAEQKYNGELQSIVLFLSISDRGAVFGLEKLIKAGYKFTGIKPLCAEHEYAIMSKTNSVYIDFNEMKMTDNMKNIFDKINAVNN